MLRQIISASSKPGDVVADFFMGSGSTVKVALELGRQAIGVELEEERFNQTLGKYGRWQGNKREVAIAAFFITSITPAHSEVRDHENE
ncbi:DNA methylase N-4/N-6 domain-containing protein [Enterobacter asburiae]|uniref:DNA methylase N-4/N-6 domain-containing protein n=1 Tax=Enterobacter asburiae TaxID=61645 RepID=A0A376FJ93_ENTAS|nr:DNA methylase N-4/N-6 domain-containing protein [Enterobacter asburiae]